MINHMAVAVAVAVSEGGAVAVAVAGLTKRCFNHIQKDFLINVWVYLYFDVQSCNLVEVDLLVNVTDLRHT